MAIIVILGVGFLDKEGVDCEGADTGVDTGVDNEGVNEGVDISNECIANECVVSALVVDSTKVRSPSHDIWVNARQF
jgi:hypothetical protein